jgi:hypothetical protein
MKKRFASSFSAPIFYFSLILFLLNTSFCIGQDAVREFQLPVKTTIRAVGAVNDSVVWFGGSNGIYGYLKMAESTGSQIAS